MCHYGNDFVGHPNYVPDFGMILDIRPPFSWNGHTYTIGNFLYETYSFGDGGNNCYGDSKNCSYTYELCKS